MFTSYNLLIKVNPRFEIFKKKKNKKMYYYIM